MSGEADTNKPPGITPTAATLRGPRRSSEPSVPQRRYNFLSTFSEHTTQEAHRQISCGRVGVPFVRRLWVGERDGRGGVGYAAFVVGGHER